MTAPEQQGIAIVNRAFLLDYPTDAARVIDALPLADAIEILTAQQPDAVAAAWRYLSPARIDEILGHLSDDSLQQVLTLIDPSLAATALARADEAQRARCLALLDPAVAKELTHLMSYPPGSAGRVMDARVTTFRPDQTAGDALAVIRAKKPRNVRKLFLLDHAQLLTAQVDITDIAMADDRQILAELAQPPQAVVSPFDSRDEVAERLKGLNVDVLPVVDVNGRLVGVIRLAALIQTVREESSANIQTMVGAGKDERALSTPLLAVRKRLPWMEINLATAFLAASVVGLFESTIARFTALAVLLPVVAGQSGNAGAQALAVTMRGLALREITVRQWLPVVVKEMSVGLLNGIAIALTCAVGVFIWSSSWGLAFVISISMVLSMIAAGIAGALVPITLTRLGQDPAQSSSIILTTVTDVAGFMSFLGIATLLAGIL